MRLVRRRLPLVHFAVDAGVWVVTIPVVALMRYDYDPSRLDEGLIKPILLAVGLQGVWGTAYGLYLRRWRYGTFDEVGILALTTMTAGLLLTIVMWREPGVPRSVAALATGFSLLGQVTMRSVWRLYNEQRARRGRGFQHRVVLVGAGEGAEQVLRTLRASPQTAYEPVALVDDDPAKRNLRLHGVHMEGRVDDVAAVAKRWGADTVLIAAPSADSEFIRRVNDHVEGLEINVLVLPPVDELIGSVRVADIRPVTEADLLGRHPVEIDNEAVAGYITGRRVLVTGAGGSIGGELCRQLARFRPAQLLMLDRDESGLHATQLAIEGRAMLDDPALILADLRDGERIDAVFAEHRPEVVFHAAALKHLPLLEMHPSEAWKTNVEGTQTVLDAARRHGVDRLVNISTDKAANPTNVLGWTKRITERLTAHASGLGPTDCVSVRFGNVLGSRGSVLQTFEAQAKAGGPITVTHPDVTRYFMTIEEACRLVIHAGAIGEPGEVMILDMGEPVRILEVAERFANQYDPPLRIEITGLRPNEKLHEALFGEAEHGERRSHDMITHVRVPGLDFEAVPDRRGVTSVERIRTIATENPKTRVS